MNQQQIDFVRLHMEAVHCEAQPGTSTVGSPAQSTRFRVNRLYSNLYSALDRAGRGYLDTAYAWTTYYRERRARLGAPIPFPEPE